MRETLRIQHGRPGVAIFDAALTPRGHPFIRSAQRLGQEKIVEMLSCNQSKGENKTQSH